MYKLKAPTDIETVEMIVPTHFPNNIPDNKSNGEPNPNSTTQITENKKNYLYLLAQKLKAEIIHHNNYIGGRYSVLSEVGMVPAELMGLKSENFRQLNLLIKNKKFINSLIANVNSN